MPEPFDGLPMDGPRTAPALTIDFGMDAEAIYVCFNFPTRQIRLTEDEVLRLAQGLLGVLLDKHRRKPQILLPTG